MELFEIIEDYIHIFLSNFNFMIENTFEDDDVCLQTDTMLSLDNIVLDDGITPLEPDEMYTLINEIIH